MAIRGSATDGFLPCQGLTPLRLRRHWAKQGTVTVPARIRAKRNDTSWWIDMLPRRTAF